MSDEKDLRADMTIRVTDEQGKVVEESVADIKRGEDMAAHEAWRREEPKRYAPWPETNLLAACPVCAESVTLEFDANHEPGAYCAYHDDPEERTHHGRCESCGASITVDMAAVERPEYAEEIRAWKAREPKIWEWRLRALALLPDGSMAVSGYLKRRLRATDGGEDKDTCE